MNKKILVLGSVLSANLVMAQTTHHYHQVTPPNNISTSGGQYFDASVKGIGKYLDQVKNDDPKLYDKLKPKYEEMQSQQTNGYIVMGVGGVLMLGGLGLSIGGVAGGDPNLSLVMAGTGVTLVGAGVMVGSMFLFPNRDDLLDFINENNRNSPNKLDLKLGFWPNLDGGGNLAMSMRF